MASLSIIYDNIYDNISHLFSYRDIHIVLKRHCFPMNIAGPVENSVFSLVLYALYLHRNIN